MFLNESTFYTHSRGIIMAVTNNVFFSNHREVSLLGACAAIRGNVQFVVIEKEDIERFATFEDSERIIVVSNVVKKHLSDAEIQAIIEHERAHIALKHLDAFANHVGIIDNMTFELEADEKAAGLVGKSVMRRALQKLIGVLTDVLINDHGINPAARPDIRKKMVEGLRPRLVALRTE